MHRKKTRQKRTVYFQLRYSLLQTQNKKNDYDECRRSLIWVTFGSSSICCLVASYAIIGTRNTCPCAVLRLSEEKCDWLCQTSTIEVSYSFQIHICYRSDSCVTPVLNQNHIYNHHQNLKTIELNFFDLRVF